MQPQFVEVRTVQKGKGLSDLDAVKKRIDQIKDAKSKSTYYKALQEGRLQIQRHSSRTYSQFDIVEVKPWSPDAGFGKSVCGECQKQYFSLEDDYLCGDCRLTSD